MTYKVVENGEDELMKIVSENVERKFINGSTNDVARNYGLISLHSCGDLTPLMLKLFNNVNEIKYLVAFSCCYHSMKVNDGLFVYLAIDWLLSITYKSVFSLLRRTIC